MHLKFLSQRPKQKTTIVAVYMVNNDKEPFKNIGLKCPLKLHVL